MNTKIAVPVDNSGMLETHFGHCRFFAIFNTSNGKITGEEILPPPPHEPGVLPRWLAELGISDVIAGGMGQSAIQIFNHNGVNVMTGAPQKPARELAEEYLTGTLKAQGNYCTH
jgi:predicted Fe-Mo cluster-binding NifX family protein